MKKILILGSSGMLGHVIYHYFNEQNKFIIYNISHKNKLNESSLLIDVFNLDQLNKLILELKPDYIVNCIGLLIKSSFNSNSNAIFLNSYFPHYLSDLCFNINAKLIHVSTDCVFKGDVGSYHEDDPKTAQDIYGSSKSLGEIIDARNLTIRTSIIGPEIKMNGEGLFDWFVKQSGIVNGFDLAFWSGVTTLQFAKTLFEIIENNEITGLIHLTNNDKISKFDLLTIIKELFKLDFIEIHSNSEYKVDKSLINSRTDFKLIVPDYYIMIEELNKWIVLHPNLYSKYYPTLFK